MSGCPAKKIITVGVVIAIIALLVPFSVSCSKPPRADSGVHRQLRLGRASYS